MVVYFRFFFFHSFSFDGKIQIDAQTPNGQIVFAYTTYQIESTKLFIQSIVFILILDEDSPSFLWMNLPRTNPPIPLIPTNKKQHFYCLFLIKFIFIEYQIHFLFCFGFTFRFYIALVIIYAAATIIHIMIISIAMMKVAFKLYCTRTIHI